MIKLSGTIACRMSHNLLKMSGNKRLNNRPTNQGCGKHFGHLGHGRSDVSEICQQSFKLSSMHSNVQVSSYFVYHVSFRLISYCVQV